jgi:membrane-associated phospholipid phosphatase
MTADVTPALAQAVPLDARPWRRAIVWLTFLGPFFFASYGFATWWTAQRTHVGAIVFEWERAIPFVPWTIVPYWTIDLLYGISLFLCATRAELDRHALRLLTAQVISVCGFLLFPLRFTFDRPEIDGIYGTLFAILGAFDKPFNQAPSLHISLLLVLWVLYAEKTPPRLRMLVHAGFVLIGLSVLTTWQHHFIDLPTGLAVGALCLWLWPEHYASPLQTFRLTTDATRRRLALRYALGAVVLVGLAALLGGAFLWLLWGALSLALVALIYLGFGPAGFQKHDGRIPLGPMLLLAPYLAGAWLNSRAWTWRAPRCVHVADGVFIGRIPTHRDVQNAAPRAIVDLCCELPLARCDCPYTYAPVLDLTVCERDLLRESVDAIERFRRRGPVLVCCALGYSRSATAVSAWLLATRRANSVDQAIAQVRAVRPGIVLTAEHRRLLAATIAECAV